MIDRRMLLAGLSATALAAKGVWAEGSYPDRMIRLVVPFPPGVPSEAVTRALADRLTEAYGQKVVVENRAGGAGGTVGSASVAAAEADGYTLLVTPPGPVVTADSLFPDLTYDPTTAFAPVALLFSSPQFMAVNPSLPVTSIAELVAYAKEHPGEINFGSPGIGTHPHLLGELLRKEAAIDIVHVPYNGSRAVLTDLMGGEIHFAFEAGTLVLPQVEAGSLRTIALAADERISKAPDLATSPEQGFPYLTASFWSGIVAPAATPPEIVGDLNTAINEAMQSPEIDAILSRLVATARLGTPDAFGQFIEDERAKWTAVIEGLES